MQVLAELLKDVDSGALGAEDCVELLNSLSYQVNITSAQDPPYFPGSFTINKKGLLRAPSQGLKGQAPKVSKTWHLGISVGWQIHHSLTICMLLAPLPSELMLSLTDLSPSDCPFT